MSTPATIAALDAVQESAAALATAVQDAKDAIAQAPDAPYYVGQVLSPELAKSGTLPVGLKFEDRDEDVYEVARDGLLVWESTTLPVALDPARYTPLTVTYVPEATQPAPTGPKVGDRVRVTEGFFGGSSSAVVGRTGTLTEIEEDHEGLGRTCYRVDGVTAGAVVPVEEVPAPSPELELELADRTVHARRSRATGGVRLELKRGPAYGTPGDRINAHLSPQETRQLAATLQAITA